MPTLTVTITHPGTAAALIKLGRSFTKLHLDAVNRRVGRVDADGNPNPFTEADVDAANATRLRKAVSIIMQHFFEDSAHIYDLRAAATEADETSVLPVRERKDQTTIDTDF